jgi:hypothetical protein
MVADSCGTQFPECFPDCVELLAGAFGGEAHCRAVTFTELATKNAVCSTLSLFGATPFVCHVPVNVTWCPSPIWRKFGPTTVTGRPNTPDKTNPPLRVRAVMHPVICTGFVSSGSLIAVPCANNGAASARNPATRHATFTVRRYRAAIRRNSMIESTPNE